MFQRFSSSICRRISSFVQRDDVPLLDMPINDVDNNSHTTIPVANGGNHGAYLRAKLRFFYMSPCWKWHLKRQFPWKAWFQFVKIIIVTTQVIDIRSFFIELLLIVVDFVWYRS